MFMAGVANAVGCPEEITYLQLFKLQNNPSGVFEEYKMRYAHPKKPMDRIQTGESLMLVESDSSQELCIYNNKDKTIYVDLLKKK